MCIIYLMLTNHKNLSVLIKTQKSLLDAILI